MQTKSELERFNDVLTKVLSVSREELLRREEEWKGRRARRRLTKPLAAVPASDDKD